MNLAIYGAQKLLPANTCNRQPEDALCRQPLIFEALEWSGMELPENALFALPTDGGG